MAPCCCSGYHDIPPSKVVARHHVALVNTNTFPLSPREIRIRSETLLADSALSRYVVSNSPLAFSGALILMSPPAMLNFLNCTATLLGVITLSSASTEFVYLMPPKIQRNVVTGSTFFAVSSLELMICRIGRLRSTRNPRVRLRPRMLSDVVQRRTHSPSMSPEVSTCSVGVGFCFSSCSMISIMRCLGSLPSGESTPLRVLSESASNSARKPSNLIASTRCRSGLICFSASFLISPGISLTMDTVGR
mmetsp:Transcript_30081/g.61951  ORF Transcript_30081/g.61951 Transcript_30081/m.61951 type:complete len:248 (+) Transcript_30081:74-817(+)